MERSRVILHADMDAFFASVEQRDRPELRGRPVIVGATSARGVVAAASYEAREFGVQSAMPGFRARELCPGGVFLRSDMRKYTRVSEQVKRVFEEFTDAVQPLALDEAFLDVTGSVALFGGVLPLARLLKGRVREETGLVVSVGVGPSKLVAKLACTLGKPDGLLIVPEHAVRPLLDPLPVRRLFGVGPVLAAELERAGFRSVGALARADLARLTRVVGGRADELVALARGEDPRPVEAERAPKSYGEENTFERDVSARDVITAALTAHAEAVARRLRHDGYVARTITVKAKLGRPRGQRLARTPALGGEPLYPVLTRRTTLHAATDDGAEIARVAVKSYDALGLAEPVRLLGVTASNLQQRAAEQLELFGSNRRRALGPTLDAIARRFGNDAVRRAVDSPEKLTPSLSKKRGE